MLQGHNADRDVISSLKGCLRNGEISLNAQVSEEKEECRMPKRKRAHEIRDQKDAKSASATLEEALPAHRETMRMESLDKFDKAVQGLRESATIKNDKGEEVSFDGETKKIFIELFRKAYPVMGIMVQSLYETGHLLSEVRKALKPQKLFLNWIRYTGIPERTTYNYLRVYEGFGKHLPQLSHLGIKRLLIASRIPNCAEYVQDNQEIIAKEPAEEFEKTVRTLRVKKKKEGGRKALYEEVGGCRVRPSGDGSKILIEGLTKERQEQLLGEIKKLLSHAKG